MSTNEHSPGSSAAAPSASPVTLANTEKPYRWWWHPHKSIADIVVSYLVSFLFRFKTVVATEPRPTPESVAISEAFREATNKMNTPAFKKQLQAWAKQQESPIAEILLAVPRRPNLLQEWNVTEDDSSSFGPNMPTGDVVVANVYLPTSILGDDFKGMLPESDNEVGAKAMPAESALQILQQVPQDVPLVVFHHGGGLNIGTARDPTILELVRFASRGHGNRPAVVVSVEYSLVPDHPFPAAPIDCLTVVSYLLEHLPPERSIHISGLSAGAHLAIVVALELLHHPTRVERRRLASLLAASPMLDPIADSESYYLNTGSSFVPPEWLRWCWQAYLGLPRGLDDDAAESDQPTTTTLDQLCQRYSNRTAYRQSRWHGGALERLVRPVVDIPSWDSDADDVALPVIVTTNRADPLHDEGLAFVEKLRRVDPERRRYQLTYLPHQGSHWLGTHIDSQAYRDLADAWGALLFPPPGGH